MGQAPPAFSPEFRTPSFCHSGATASGLHRSEDQGHLKVKLGGDDGHDDTGLISVNAPRATKPVTTSSMNYSAQIIGQIDSHLETYYVVRWRRSRGPGIYLQKEADNQAFSIVDVYQGQVLGQFVMRLLPNDAPSDSLPIDLPISSIVQYGSESLPLALESARNGYFRQDNDTAKLSPQTMGVSSLHSNAKTIPLKEPILGLRSKNASLWSDSIAGVLHEQNGAHYYVINRTTAALGKIQYPFLQDKFGQVWQVREQRVKGWLKKMLIVDLFSCAGLTRTISVVGVQDAVDRNAGSAVRWVTVAQQSRSSIDGAPAAGIFIGMEADFFWQPSDPQRLIAESNARANTIAPS